MNAAPTQETRTVAGVDLHLHLAGDPAAPAVVLLHGGGLTGGTWRRVMQRLAGRYYCIAPDLRGHGDSGWDPSGAYSLDLYAADLTAVVGELGLQRPHVVGMSLGGQTALCAAIRGLPLRSLTLVDVGPRLVPAGGQPIRDFLDVPSFASFDDALAAAARLHPRRRRDSLRESLQRSLRQRPDGSWTWKWDPRRTAGRDDRARQAAGLWPDLHRIGVPVLVVRGGRSPLFSTELAAELAAELNRTTTATLAVVEDAGHSVQSDQPDQLADLLSTFLARAEDVGAQSLAPGAAS